MKQAWMMNNQVADLKKKPLPANEGIGAKGDNAQKQEKDTVKGTLKTWASNSSTHGVGSLERSTHIARKLFWLCAVLVGIGLTISQVVDLFLKFKAYPVSISLNLTSTTLLAFPAITFCNVNAVRKSMLAHADEHLTELLPVSYGGNDTSRLRTHASRAELKTEFFNGWVKLNKTLKTQLGHQAEDMILDCTYNGLKCGPQNFSRFMNPQFGNCYVFNSGWEDHAVQLSHKSGPEYGLTLEFFIEQEEYLAELTESAGIMLSIHPQNIMPFPQDDSVLAHPGSLTFISLTMVNITRLPDPFPSGCWDLNRKQSIEHSVYSEHYDVEYNLPACQKTCYQSHVVNECNCSDPTLPMHGQAITGSSHGADPCTTESDFKCEERVKVDYKTGHLGCQCQPPCLELEYFPQTSSSQWPNQVFSDIYYEEIKHENPHVRDIMENSHLSNPDDDLVKVQVFFSDLNYEAVSEIEAYSSSSLIADIGGMLGLFLGLSIVGLFEIVELVFDLLRVGCSNFTNKQI